MNATNVLAKDTVSYHIALASREHRKLVAKQLSECGLYLGQELILMQLFQEDNLCQYDLAARVGVDVSTMTKALQRIESYGLVIRHSDPKDSRVMRVCLTGQGRALEDKILSMWSEVEHQTMVGFSAEERSLLIALLQRVTDNLK